MTADMFTLSCQCRDVIPQTGTNCPFCLLCIFVPTAPNVTTGFVIMVPKEEVVELDMTPEEGMKLILSVGAVEPAWGAAAQPMKNEK